MFAWFSTRIFIQYSINCYEISVVTWFRHRSSLLQIPFQIPLFRNSLCSNQQKQKRTGQNISSQTHPTFTFLNKSETVLSLKEFLLLMLRYANMIFRNQKVSFWCRTFDISEKSVGVVGRGLGWHGFGMEPNWSQLIWNWSQNIVFFSQLDPNQEV